MQHATHTHTQATVLHHVCPLVSVCHSLCRCPCSLMSCLSIYRHSRRSLAPLASRSRPASLLRMPACDSHSHTYTRADTQSQTEFCSSLCFFPSLFVPDVSLSPLHTHTQSKPYITAFVVVGATAAAVAAAAVDGIGDPDCNSSAHTRLRFPFLTASLSVHVCCVTFLICFPLSSFVISLVHTCS